VGAPSALAAEYVAWLRGTTDKEWRKVAQLRSYGSCGFTPRRVKILDDRAFGSAVFIVADIPRRT
jgi:hypothetical protein